MKAFLKVGLGLDVSHKSLAAFKDVVAHSKLIVWSDPLGEYEFEKFARGAKDLMDAVVEATKNGNTSIFDVGDIATARKDFGAEDSLSHVSTSGGSSLELLEGNELPGVTALPSK